jgi:hypothetical protein
MLMGVERIEAISREMLANGMRADLPVALIRWATTGRQETLVGTLENIAARVQEKKFAAPAVAVFGNVVSLRDELNWFEGRSLAGKRIVVTRTRTQAGVLSNQLRAMGADVIELPTIRIEPPSDLRAFAELVQDAHVYDWIVFTSPNGVNSFFDLFYKLYDDARELGPAKIAAIGRRRRSGSRTSTCMWICSRRSTSRRRWCASSRSRVEWKICGFFSRVRKRRGTCSQGSSPPWGELWMKLLRTELCRNARR